MQAGSDFQGRARMEKNEAKFDKLTAMDDDQ
jgi:hypothetical protein